MAGIFKKNDIRGVFNETLTEELTYQIAVNFVKYMEVKGEKLRTAAIAGDSRLSTPAVKNAFMQGLIEMGVNVYDLGIGPSPMIYFTSASQEIIDAGIMITASHNPKNHNGIKICDSTGSSYHYDNLYKHIEMNINNEYESKDLGLKKDGSQLREGYYNFLESKFKFRNKLKILVEVGNGAAGEFIDVLQKLKCDVLALNKDPDGNFPSLLPDPTNEETYENIRNQLKRDSFDLCIAFDGDGDRVGFMSNSGKIIPQDKVIMFYADQILGEKQGQKIIIDVKISKATSEYIESKNGVVILSQVGHSWVHENVIHENAAFAGELSGHYYFNDKYHGFDDGLYSALRFLQIVDGIIDKGENLDILINKLPEYSTTPEFREEIGSEMQDKILEKLSKYVVEKDGTLIDIDGIRGEFAKGWFIARKSSTEERLSYRVEGIDENEKIKILHDIQNIIKSTLNV